MEIAFSIRLICADRVIVGEEGDDTQGHEQEVISDTLLVLLDFLAYFQQNHSQPYNVVTSATIDPFTERLNDRLAGNSVTIQIRQPFDWNKCQIPQTGAAIPPTVDGLTLYNFCDPAVIARLSPTQVACLESAICPTPEDANWELFNTDGTLLLTGSIPSGGTDSIVAPNGIILVNQTQFETVVSGGDMDVPVVNTDGDDVGSAQSGDWVIGNSEVFINAVQVADIVAEDTANLAVELDGVPSGTWNAGTQTWEVTSVPCPQDLTIRVQVALAADAFTFTATTNEAGTITAVNDGGLSAFVLSVNATPVTAPFSIANADVISAAFTAAGATTTVILTGTY
jgi:hypothetical protein